MLHYSFCATMCIGAPFLDTPEEGRIDRSTLPQNPDAPTQEGLSRSIGPEASGPQAFRPQAMRLHAIRPQPEVVRLQAIHPVAIRSQVTAIQSCKQYSRVTKQKTRSCKGEDLVQISLASLTVQSENRERDLHIPSLFSVYIMPVKTFALVRRPCEGSEARMVDGPQDAFDDQKFAIRCLIGTSVEIALLKVAHSP